MPPESVRVALREVDVPEDAYTVVHFGSGRDETQAARNALVAYPAYRSLLAVA